MLAQFNLSDKMDTAVAVVFVAGYVMVFEMLNNKPVGGGGGECC